MKYARWIVGYVFLQNLALRLVCRVSSYSYGLIIRSKLWDTMVHALMNYNKGSFILYYEIF